MENCRGYIMKKTVDGTFARVIVLGMLILSFIIPLSMMRSIVAERAKYSQQAEASIAQSWATSQTVLGPILGIPYTYDETVTVKSLEAGGKDKEIRNTVRKIKYILPEELRAKGEIIVEERTRGIFRVPTYTAQITISGNFIIESLINETNKPNLELGAPFLSVGVDDIRGIGTIDNVVLDNKPYSRIEAGSKSNVSSNGIHIPLDDDLVKKTQTPLDFKMNLSIKGLKSLSFVPVGRNNTLEISSNWTHPSFSGQFLPEKRDVTKTGFNAIWRAGFLATNAENIMRDNPDGLSNINFSIELLKPLDIYDLTIRALKYGLLFIGLTFMAFFVFETLQKLRIHPMQYGLLGATLAMFYLLILSLSEHIGFLLAYTVATFCVAALLGYYVSFIVRSSKTGLLYGLLISLLYGTLYLILQSEDFALLAGTFVLFGALAITMIATKKVDWYKLGNNNDEPENKSS